MSRGKKRIDTLAVCESVSDAWKVALKLGPKAVAIDKTLSVGVESMKGVPQVVLYKEEPE